MNDFKYVGSWVDSTAGGGHTNQKRPCVGCRKQDKENVEIKYLKEPQEMSLRGNCGISIPVIVLLGSEVWTLTKSLEKQLNGCYTRLLRMVFNVHWKEHVTNEELCGTMVRVTDKIQEHRTQFAGQA